MTKSEILAKYLIGPDAPEDENTNLSGNAEWVSLPPAISMSEGGFVTVPATPIERVTFTIGIWVRPMVAGRGRMVLYANWKPIWSFMIYLVMRGAEYTVRADLRRNIDSSGNDPEQDLATCEGGVISPGTWKHVSVTWDRDSAMLSILVDGILVASANRLPHAGDELDIQVNGSQVHEVGYKADGQSDFFIGQLRELTIMKGLLTKN